MSKLDEVIKNYGQVNPLGSSHQQLVDEATAELAAYREAVEEAKEAIDLSLNWEGRTQSDEYLIETRLKEAFTKLEAL